ncbi:MAG: SDR family NAD(P)-dependent oxidoreductase, partial [Sedimenticolaceae bacterium]
MTKRVALVTGGNGGIGSAICRELASQGHTVVAGYFPPEKEIAEAWQKEMDNQGFTIALAAMDVSSFEDSERAIGEIAEKHGSVEILVNCAGITRDGTLKKMPEAAWKAVIATNLDSAFNTTRHVINGMLDKGWGRIVNISSVNGQRGQFGQANYSAAKAGMHGFTMAVALETAAKGITVNTVSPGYIATAMTEAMPENVLE